LKSDLEKEKYTVSITINADHYYQPQKILNAKAQSEKAAADLKTAGMTKPLIDSQFVPNTLTGEFYVCPQT